MTAIEVRGRNLVLLAIGSYFFLANVMQSVVALSADRLHLAGFQLGILLALVSGGVGIMTDIGFATYADACGRAQIVRGGFIGSLLSLLLLLDEKSIFLIWLSAIIFGFCVSATGNALLGMLTLHDGRWDQARLQGVNGSVQRFGSLIGAAVLGLGLLLHSVFTTTLGLIVVACVGVVAMWKYDVRQKQANRQRAQLDHLQLLVAGYRSGFTMLKRPAIGMAVMLSMGINAIFMETNSFIPLAHTMGASAWVVSGSLVMRDLIAIGFGLLLAKSRVDVAKTKIVAPAMMLAALAAVGMGGALDSRALPLLVLLAAVQGMVVAIGIAATNLYTISATSLEDRALGMAASGFTTKGALIFLPIIAGAILSSSGLAAAFYLVGGVLLSLGVLITLVGQHTVGEPGL